MLAPILVFFLRIFLPALIAFAPERVTAQNGPTTWTTNPFNPPAFPLAVKTPYVNAWLPQGNNPASLSTFWPRLGSPNLDVLGWFSAILVDGKPYRLMGGAPDPAMTAANQTAVTLTPSRTSFLMTAGNVTVNATFLSPVQPTDLVQMSLPFSYYYLSISSNDGAAHDVRVYTDISAEWISGDDTLNSNWTFTDDGSILYLQSQLTSPTPFHETNEHPQDAIVYHAMKHRQGMKWQIARDNDARGLFANGTGLHNTNDPNFHAVGSPYFNVFAISVDLGNITSTVDPATKQDNPVVWALGVVRDPVVQYTNSHGQLEERSAYYWSKYATIHDAIAAVLNDFPSLVTNASIFDNSVLSAGLSSASSEYADLLLLSTRQALGALDFTVVAGSDGKLNTSDVKAFMRDAGGIGTGGVNAVDVIYAAMPMYLYLNPDVLGYLIKPLLEYQESSLYPNNFAAQDLGPSYSIATGNNQGHNQGIEQSANMIIMAYAHAQRSGDGSLLAQHYSLLKKWADYLESTDANPVTQQTSASDLITTNNLVNLILKRVISFGAMAKISMYTSHSDDESHFQNLATQQATAWQQQSISSDQSHLLSAFGQSTSSGLIYNLYAHQLLGLSLFPDSVFSIQSSFYGNELTQNKYGLPLDSTTGVRGRSDWLMFAAAAATSDNVRNSIITMLHAYASPNLENLPFAVVYSVNNGSQISGINSPAQGAMYALLGKTAPIKTIVFPTSMKPKHAGVIAGAVVAAVVGLSVVAAGMLFFLRHRRRRQGKRLSGYNDRADRIIAAKRPAVYASESLLEPLGTSLLDSSRNPNSGNSSESLQRANQYVPQHVTTAPQPQAYSGPFAVQNFTEEDNVVEPVSSRHNVQLSVDAGTSIATSSLRNPVGSRPPLPLPSKQELHQEDLRTEVDNLRREVERMRQERTLLSEEAPPSYDEEIARSLGGPR